MGEILIPIIRFLRLFFSEKCSETKTTVGVISGNKKIPFGKVFGMFSWSSFPPFF